MNTLTYPVHVDAHLDPHLNRGLWLIKWALAIPHYLVLAFLWAAFVVMSVVAFFAILFTGRYPRAVFDFNVGVLRWTWRVGYYTYSALGTDQYPPFSLREDPDYPAHLEVDYPDHLSRGLVLVKWWLLALPHYLVVAILVGGTATVASEAGADERWSSGVGLIGLLVLIAAVALLFTGRYPQQLFDLVLGLNRWVLRVAAYAGLMTDRYPPFRLDQGGHEAGSGCLVLPAADSPPTTEAAPPHPSTPVQEWGRHDDPTRPGPATGHDRVTDRATGWTTGRVIALVASSLLLLLSLGLAIGGGAAAWADNSQRDDAGYLMSDSELLTTGTYAITSEPMEIQVADAIESLPQSVFGRAKVTADAADGEELFLGVARADDVDRYLAGVAHATLTDLGGDGPSYDMTDGAAPSTAPADADIWRTSTSGTGELAITWPVDEGTWTVVAMNADGSAGVEADMAAGATLPALDWVTPLLLSLGAAGLVVGVVALALTIRSASAGSGADRAAPNGEGRA